MTKIVNKTRKSITANANGTKITVDGYFDLQTFKMKPISPQFIDQLAEKLIVWVDSDEDALIFEEFFKLTKIYSANFYEWLEKSENLKRAHEYAKSMLAIRREKGGLKRKLDPGMVQASMPMYSKAWKEMTEWKAKLKEESAAQANNITVVIDKVPDSPIVKEKKT